MEVLRKRKPPSKDETPKSENIHYKKKGTKVTNEKTTKAQNVDNKKKLSTRGNAAVPKNVPHKRKIPKNEPNPQSSVESLLNKVISGKIDDICALCLSEESLLSLSHSLTVKDTFCYLRITVRQLLYDLHMAELCNELPTLKICSECITQMSNFFLFKKKCVKARLAFSNFIDIVYEGTAKTSALIMPKKTKKTSLWLPYDSIMEYADAKVIATQRDKVAPNCSQCALFFSRETGIAITKVNSRISHHCGICKRNFDDHMATMEHWETEHKFAELSSTGIRERHSDLFACKWCDLKNVNWAQYVVHTEVHTHERATEMIIKKKLFCCCCMSESGKLVSVSREICMNPQMNGENISIEQLLARIFNTEKLDRYNPILICEECIGIAITTYNFEQTYKTTTKTLRSCFAQLERSLNAIGEHDARGDAIDIQINFNFNRSTDSSEFDTIDWNDNDVGAIPDSPEGLEKVKIRKSSKIFACTKCDKYFRFGHDLAKHNKLHKKMAKSICRMCNKSFRFKSKLIEHQDKVHSNSSYCAACRQVFDRDEIDDHIKHQHGTAVYICDDCNKCFNRKDRLIDHILFKHGSPQNERPTKCKNCWKVFKSNDDCLKHSCAKCIDCLDYPCVHREYLEAFEHQHKVNPNSEQKCINCNYTYNNKHKYIEHVNKDHLLYYPHICPKCEESYPSRKALTEHINKHFSKRCPFCYNTFKRYLHKNHVKLCKFIKKPFNCDLCEGIFSSEKRLAQHRKYHLAMNRCKVCSRIFMNEMKLNNHICTYNEIRRKKKTKPTDSGGKENVKKTTPCMCDVCGRVFKTFYALKLHQPSHKNQVQCEHCFKFINANLFEVHLYRQHAIHPARTKPGDIPFVEVSKGVHSEEFQSEKGQRTTGNREGSVQRMTQTPQEAGQQKIRHKKTQKNLEGRVGVERMVKGERVIQFVKKYECKECSYVAYKRHYYISHLNKYHLKITPYPCKLCGKAYHNKAGLRSHMLVHRGWVAECKDCPKKFTSPAGLTLHQRLHTGERPYTCDICNQSFISVNRMNEHKKRLHCEPSFECEFCDKAFVFQRYLNNHMREVHAGEKRQKQIKTKKD